MSPDVLTLADSSRVGQSREGASGAVVDLGYFPPSLDAIKGSLDALAHSSIAIIGDLCLDGYWWLSESDERSLETGLVINHVQRQRWGLGAAGNVAANAKALGVGQVELMGVVGPDPFGDLVIGLAQSLGIATGDILRPSDWQTMVYAKPMASDGERGRFDFGAGNRLEPALVEALAEALERAASRHATVIINQQVGQVMADPGLVAHINATIARHPATTFLVDARVGADAYRGASLKLNAREAARLLGLEGAAEDAAGALACARALHARTGCPIFLTRGERGMVAVDAQGAVASVPGIQILGPIDPVGAGDTVVAVVGAVCGCGGTPSQAAYLANLAAAVTVRQLHTTGTATPAGILETARTVNHVYHPDLAGDARQASRLSGTDIEIIGRPARGLAIAHAIFDHDGTISTLRQGWEAIMEPMMVRAVLGPASSTIAPGRLAAVVARVRALIDQTTGIQTLAQMAALADLVRAQGYVPASDILDAHGYKRIYNDALVAEVRRRTDQLARGERDPVDFQVKGAVRLLERLHAAGVRLYLASGTDHADVQAEAEILGYAHLFTGGIFGAVGSLSVEAKRAVIERILREHAIAGDRLLVIGDGPVEMREGRRCGALCIGVASDEVRRYGWDLAKRSRLIRAGADLVVPDFSQAGALLGELGFPP